VPRWKPELKIPAFAAGLGHVRHLIKKDLRVFFEMDIYFTAS